MDAEGHKNYLYERMLEADEPEEFTLISEALRKYSGELVPQLWNQLKIETNEDRRFRAMFALISSDPSDPRFELLARIGKLGIGPGPSSADDSMRRGI
jgi:hypothetical protein